LIFDEAFLLELGKLGGDAGLSHAKNLLQLGDREGVAGEKKENSKPSGIS
jgi:hypothetical protein